MIPLKDFKQLGPVWFLMVKGIYDPFSRTGHGLSLIYKFILSG